MENRIERLCGDKGLRMTSQRRVIARVLSDAEDHPSVPDVHKRAAKLDPSISIATVYRTVRLLEETGISKKSFILAIEQLTKYYCKGTKEEKSVCLNDKKSSWLSSHPTGASRLKYLRENIN